VFRSVIPVVRLPESLNGGGVGEPPVKVLGLVAL
jgi:hypothetical protein